MKISKYIFKKITDSKASDDRHMSQSSFFAGHSDKLGAERAKITVQRHKRATKRRQKLGGQTSSFPLTLRCPCERGPVYPVYVACAAGA